MTSSPELLVVVVSRDLNALLASCLRGVAVAVAEAGVEAEVVVVDNASSPPYRPDEFQTALPLSLLRCDRSQSFGRANNLAASARGPSRLLLVNNDVLLHPRALQAMLVLLERTPGAGVCGCRLLFPDGTIQHCGVVFGGGETGPYHANRRRPNDLVARAPVELQAVSGACMLIDGRLWQELGGLDESYPFGLEDIDFCLRARRRGWRIMCERSVDSLHFESMTPGRVELDVPSRRMFMERWRGRYGIDG